MANDPAAINEAFAAFDRDGNGTISVQELHQAVSSLIKGVTEAEIRKMMKQVDQNNDGVLNKKEFKALLDKVADNEKELKAAFKAFDADGSGHITKAELKKAMKKMGASLSDAELEDMIKSADSDSDGKVSFDEFKRMMDTQ